jgi:hypothetical protein
MLRGTGVSRRVWIGGAALAGLVGAHMLGYLLAAPDHHERASLLHETGHSNWTNPLLFVGAIFIAALISFSQSWAGPRAESASVHRIVTRTAMRLLPVQAIGFVILEMTERAWSDGASAFGVFGEKAVLFGLVLQVLTALVCALLLVVFSRIVRSLRKTSVKHAAEPAPSATYSFVGVPTSIARCAWNLRGPPVSP